MNTQKMLVTHFKRKPVIYGNSDFFSPCRIELDIFGNSLIRIIYKCIILVLIIHNVEFCVYIARKAALVMVKVLLVNIRKNSNLGRSVSKFKLVRRHLNNGIGIGRNALKRFKNRHADIADKPCVLACRL